MKKDSDVSVASDSKNKHIQGKDDNLVQIREGSDRDAQKVNSTIQEINQAQVNNSRHSV